MATVYKAAGQHLLHRLRSGMLSVACVHRYSSRAIHVWSKGERCGLTQYRTHRRYCTRGVPVPSTFGP